ncbi:hypothetical protein AB1Y20_018193 [Prymnesium parvum]|uniref:Uncharacterized protein n=1 Tax=Prymnesium parvum TaxID=97485 RepID=A0AB34JPZ4_PRYPA
MPPRHRAPPPPLTLPPRPPASPASSGPATARRSPRCWADDLSDGSPLRSPPRPSVGHRPMSAGGRLSHPPVAMARAPESPRRPWSAGHAGSLARQPTACTISMKVKELHAHIGALEARVSVLQQQNAMLQSRSNSYEQAIEAQRPPSPRLSPEAVPPGTGEAKASPSAPSSPPASPQGQAGPSQLLSSLLLASNGLQLPQKVPLTGWRSNLQSEMENKALTASNFALRRGIDKSRCDVEAIKAELAKAKKRASNAERNLADMARSHHRAVAEAKERKEQDDERTRDAFHRLLQRLFEVAQDPLRILGLVDRFLVDLDAPDGPKEILERIEVMLAAEQQEADQAGQKSAPRSRRSSFVEREEKRMQEVQRIQGEFQAVVTRTQEHLSSLQARAESQQGADRVGADSRGAPVNGTAACFGVSPKRKSMASARKPFTAAGWVASTGVTEVIARALLAQVPAFTASGRSEGLYLFELGRASGVEVIEHLFEQGEIVSQLCQQLWSALSSLDEAEVIRGGRFDGVAVQ